MPFGVDELLARIRVLLRRHAAEDTGSVVRFGEIRVDLVRHEVRKRGTPVLLAPIEFRILAALLHGKGGGVLTYRQLLLDVWGPGHAERTHYLRVHMANLRQKLEDDPAQPRHLISELQVGYRLVGL